MILYQLIVIYSAPTLGHEEFEAINRIEELKRQLRWGVAEPKRWYGNLRRQVFARAVQGSNSIEGYSASLEDVIAAVDDEDPLDATEEIRVAIEGYRDAMTYVLQLAEDRDRLEIDETLIKALHFMMLKHDLPKWPGRYRPGAGYVQRAPAGEVVYEGADVNLVPTLMKALVDALRPHDTQPLVAAAIAHLNLAMVHPFKDGNGRLARCLHTLVLARESAVAPVFSSIEEYLGRNTEAYHKVLGEVGQGSWHPTNDARPWVRFCLNAHFQQVQTHLWRIREAEELWDRLELLAAERRLPDRVVGPLSDAARGLRLRNSSYRKAVSESAGDKVDVQTASRDLRSLVERGLLETRGETKGRLYTATDVLREAFIAVRRLKPARVAADLFPPDKQSPLGHSPAG